MRYRLVETCRPKYVENPMPTPSLKKYTSCGNGRRVLLNPRQPAIQWVSFFFIYIARYIFEVYISRYFGLRKSQTPSQHNRKIKVNRVRQLPGKKSYDTCANTLDLSPENAVSILTFVQNTCATTPNCCVIAWFQHGINCGRQ